MTLAKVCSSWKTFYQNNILELRPLTLLQLTWSMSEMQEGFENRPQTSNQTIQKCIIEGGL